MRSMMVGALMVAVATLAPVATAQAAPKCTRTLVRQGVLPDLETVVPKHLTIQNEHQREFLRFTNGVANRGAGDWRLRPEPPPGTASFTDAVQEIQDASGNVLCEKVVSTFEFHADHNHWHVGDVALFEVRVAQVGDDGTGGLWGATLKNDRGQAQSIKVGFCLIDSYKLDDNAPTTERIYWDCETSFQGISPGWVDQYHQSLEGQEIDITGARPGIYYLVSTANPDRTFLEADLTDNTAWVSFLLTRDSRGNPKLVEIVHSPCGSPGMCGEQATNR